MIHRLLHLFPFRQHALNLKHLFTPRTPSTVAVMEVNRKDYWRKHLLPILQHISKASYVAFDLEFSGIKSTQRRTNEAGKPSLQQLYEENREVAEKFTIVQVGITCVEENLEKGYYIARPYNFYLSPLSIKRSPSDKLEIKLDRLVSFSSETCEFLRGHNLDLGKIFSEGIHYLSVQEERDLTQAWEDDQNTRENKPDIIIPPNDAAAHKFYRDAKKRIREWVDDESPSKGTTISILNESGAMNGFQRLLIYQLVRKEFPGYRAYARDDRSFMRIEEIDPEREAKDLERKKHYLRRDIAKQTGLRWIFEALSNGDLDGIDPSWLCEINPEDKGYHKELQRKQQELAQVKEELLNKDHVLVGHNLFTDLCFLYQTFFESLPMSVKNFQNEIHCLFPTLYDTKFLASYGYGSLRPNTSLGTLLEPYKLTHKPIVSLHSDEGFQSYRDATMNDKAHEAGYDSWMTAELFAKLSVKLYDDRKHTLKSPPSKASSDSEDENLLPQPSFTTSPTSSSSSKSAIVPSDSEGGVKLSPFTSTNKFAALNLNDSGDAEAVEDKEEEEEIDLPASYYAQRLNANGKKERREMMPRFDGQFWEIYRNKLQVNASDAGFCDVAEYDDEA